MEQTTLQSETGFTENELITLAFADAYGEINYLLEEKLMEIHDINKHNKKQGYASTYQENFEIVLQKIHSLLKENFFHYVCQADEILTRNYQGVIK